MKKWKIAIKFEPRDFWIGVYWTHYKPPASEFSILHMLLPDEFQVYICLVPFVPIVIRRMLTSAWDRIIKQMGDGSWPCPKQR